MERGGTTSHKSRIPPDVFYVRTFALAAQRNSLLRRCSRCSLFKTYFRTCFGHSTILRKTHCTKIHSTTSVRKKYIT